MKVTSNEKQTKIKQLMHWRKHYYGFQAKFTLDTSYCKYTQNQSCLVCTLSSSHRWWVICRWHISGEKMDYKCSLYKRPQISCWFPNVTRDHNVVQIMRNGIVYYLKYIYKRKWKSSFFPNCFFSCFNIECIFENFLTRSALYFHKFLIVAW